MIRSPDLHDRPSRGIAFVSLLIASLAMAFLIACWSSDQAHAQAGTPNQPTTPPPNTPPPATPPQNPGGGISVETRLPDLGRDLGLPELGTPGPNVLPEVGGDAGRLVLLVPIGGAPAVAADYDLQVLQLASLQSIGRDMMLADPPNGLGPVEAIALIELDPRVEIVQLDLPYQVQRGPAPVLTERTTPVGDPGSLLQQQARAEGVLIGLIDSAVDVRHPALADASIELVDVVGGSIAAEDVKHGTAMAGAILGGDQAGGEARGARLLAIRAFAAAGSGSARSATFAVAQAVDLAAVKRVDVLNLSFAGPRDPLVARLLGRAAQLGVLAVAAAGNAGPGAPPAYPAALAEVLAVTAIDGKDRIYKQANQGPYVGLAAAGVDVIVAGPGGGYAISSGTSIAAAKVSGLAAAILGQSGGIKPAALDELLRRTAVDLGPSGPDQAFGAGKVDGPAARAAAQGLALKDG